MKRISTVALAWALTLAGLMCHAQQDPVPFGRLQQNAGVPAQASALVGEDDLSPAEPSGSAGSLISSTAPSTVRPKILTRTYFLLNGLHLALALADVEATQHCIANHRCEEGNPLMPSSQAGQIGINVGLFAYAAGSSYWLRKHKTRWWWAPPATGIAAHAAGVASGLRNW